MNHIKCNNFLFFSFSRQNKTEFLDIYLYVLTIECECEYDMVRATITITIHHSPYAMHCIKFFYLHLWYKFNRQIEIDRINKGNAIGYIDGSLSSILISNIETGHNVIFVTLNGMLTDKRRLSWVITHNNNSLFFFFEHYLYGGCVWHI